MSDPKAETYIPGWLNKLHRESVSSDGSVLKKSQLQSAIEEMLIKFVHQDWGYGH